MLRTVVLAFCVALCVAAPTAPPRPVPSDFFTSGIFVEFDGVDGKLTGDGFMAWDPSTNNGLVDYKLHHPLRPFPLYVYNLLRFDLQEVFEIDSEDKNECRMRVVSGPLPNYWSWLPAATFTGIDFFKGVQIDLWSFTNSQGFAIQLGVQAPYYNIPFVLYESSRGFTKITQFDQFTANSTINPKYFAVPKECQGVKASSTTFTPASKLGAPAPPRPVIPDNFQTQVEISDVQGTLRLQGEGVFGYDYAQNMAVDDQKLRAPLNTIRVFELQRFDLGQIFEIDSKDSQECRMREVTGHIPPPWDWLANATYIGQDVFRHNTIDLWAQNFGSTSIELGVNAPNYDTPLFTRQRGPGFEIVNVFNKYIPNPTFNPKFFTVPSECQSDKKALPKIKFTPNL